jgi:hypothetical protein
MLHSHRNQPEIMSQYSMMQPHSEQFMLKYLIMILYCLTHILQIKLNLRATITEEYYRTKCKLPPMYDLATCFTMVSCLAYPSTLEVDISSSETSTHFQRTIWRYIPEDGMLTSISSSFWYTDYMVNPRHVSITQDHLQCVYSIRGKKLYYIYINCNN